VGGNHERLLSTRSYSRCAAFELGRVWRETRACANKSSVMMTQQSKEQSSERYREREWAGNAKS
jgi:hypothetical protein